jgi:hypothetical protein
MVALLPGKKFSDTHWIGGLVGPRTSLYNVEKKNYHYRDSNSTSAVQPAASCYTDYAIPVENDNVVWAELITYNY